MVGTQSPSSGRNSLTDRQGTGDSPLDEKQEVNNGGGTPREERHDTEIRG